MFFFPSGNETGEGYELQCGGVRHGPDGSHTAAALLPAGRGEGIGETHASEVKGN